MAMGRRKKQRQQSLFVAAADLPQSAAHPFYAKLNEVLAGWKFDSFVEGICQQFYAEKLGRPSLAPGIYFRLLLIGYFEGINSERGIAWRGADSLSLRSFVGYEINEASADHSTISRTRRLIDLETHQEVFQWVLKVLADYDLVSGKTIGVDATTLEANAAMRSIVRKDTKQNYQAFLTDLAKASGIETPTREDLVKLDKKRKNKASNDDWENPHDPDAKITKMKDGTTHLAHKQEHWPTSRSTRWIWRAARCWRSPSSRPTKGTRPPGVRPLKRRTRISTRSRKTSMWPIGCIRIR
jgi:transposase